MFFQKKMMANSWPIALNPISYAYIRFLNSYKIIASHKICFMTKFLAGLFLVLFLSFDAAAQRMEYGINGFGTSYFGELNNTSTMLNNIRYGGGLHIRRHLNPWWSLRGDVNWARIAGTDNLPNVITDFRNLSFRSDIVEFTGVFELRFREIGHRRNDYKMTPYLFGGLNLFRFNPKAEFQDTWYDLKPLSTEGQGLLEYPESLPYSLTQIGIPLGAGLRWALNRDYRLSFEIGYRVTFTDHLDDVSGLYVNSEILAANRGPIAAALADRRQELSSGLSPAIPGSERGSARDNDAFLYVGFSISKVVFNKTCPRWK